MRRSYTLPPLNRSGRPLVFTWDPSTGEVSGEHGEFVATLAAEAVYRGYVTGHPHPTPYKVTDPLRKPGELAVLLGNLYHLTDDLRDAYPPPPSGNDLPPGAIG